MVVSNQRGFGIVGGLVVAVVIGLLIAGAWFTFGRGPREDKQDKANKISWYFDGESWTQSGTPPACPEPILKTSPVDTSLATAILQPGQYRGRDYKAHGGFRFDNSNSTDIDVRLPMDAQLTGVTHYIEAGELQYLVTFIHPCGIMYRFDHLYTLTPAFKKFADELPPPKTDDTRSLPIDGPDFKAGELLATAVGLPEGSNVSVDFGVYDLRNPNEISKDPKWAALHQDHKEQGFFGACWFDMLPKNDSARVWALVNAADPTKTVSDYCKIPGGSTLQYNQGRPVE